MSFDWASIALQTVNFAILVWLLHRFLYRPVLRMIDARRAEADKIRAAAAKATADAERRLSEVEAERASIAAERAETMKAAAADAEAAAAKRREAAEREAQAAIAAARKTIAAEREDALAGIRGSALDLGVDIARRLLGEVPTELRAEAWLERIEQHLAGLPASERARICDGVDDGTRLKVVTAVPLPPPVAEQWRDRLGRALKDHIEIAFDVDEALIAGTELYFPSAILRFSWRSALADMRAEIENHGHAH